MVPPLQNKKRKIFSFLFCGISLEKWLKLTSAFLVSLMIGIFTIVTTSQQNHVANLNRIKDLEIANNQRQQDQEQADELHIETVYARYITEMSELFMKKDHPKLSKDEMLERLIFGRAKTLTTLRQIDIRRKNFLIFFLYEANLLNVSKNPIDLTGANLTGINLGDVGYSLKSISLKNCILINASFSMSNLEYANFYGSILDGANFSYSRLGRTNFTNCELSRTDFRHSFIYDSYFDNVNMRGALFPDSIIPLIDNAIAPNGSFVYSTYMKVRRTNLVDNGEPLCANVSFLSLKQRKWLYVGTNKPIATIVSCHFDRQEQCCFGGRKENNDDQNLDEYLYQQIDVFDYSRLIDSGKAKYNFSAYLGGMEYYNDYAYMDIEFMIKNVHVDSNKPVFRLGPVTNTERRNRTTFVYREKIDVIPKYTRQITIKMVFKKYSNNSDSSGLVHSVKLSITDLNESYETDFL
ncbi:unnamed protein product [Didymodactylos carnosus]|uniref:Pentapeptide repeat-containing protein n=1 Tax=Didymodactylos carnosus TaxID=1234261 RepID=A0A815X5Y7_9BILA|nr:unnamed protein product [Didymodactylos carnosus]CAF1553409.1 unnamed protein product [Didymodactylos carnosus]CAF4163153.1 unnamed protein product [Didymodactylos carnosus]CAF4414535.1 unnamed protein product [Didymodactylos carnosus]